MRDPYQPALSLALEKLAVLDWSEVAFNSSASLSDDGLLLPFLGETFRITQKGQHIKSVAGNRLIGRFGEETNREPKIAEKIIILHYLVTADSTPLSREAVAFENLSGSAFYYPTYKARTIDLITATFNNDLKRFLTACARLNARITPADYLTSDPSSARATILPLPNVPITFVFWKGDNEISPALQILYDANINHYLPAEDIVVLTELLVHKLITPLQTGNGHPFGRPLYT